MRIKLFEPPLPDFDQMSYGGEVKPRKMQRGGEPDIGFVPDSTRFTPSQVQTQTQVRNSVQQNLANIPTGNATREQLRELAEEIFREQGFMDEGERGIYGRGGFDPVGARELRAQEIENILDRLLENRGIETGVAPPVTGVDQETVVQTIQDMLAEGTLTAEEIQRRIDAGDITKDDVLAIIQGGFELSEGQLAQLFEAGVLTREEIAALVEEAIADVEAGEGGVTEEDVERIAQASGLSEERVQELISEQLQSFDPSIDTSQFATQEQLQGLATQEQLGDFATRQDLAGLESLFQNYLTPEQLQSYLPQEGQYVTPEQLAAATDNDYDEVIKGLTDQLGELESKYQDVQSQYEADAVNAQIQQTKDDLDTFFRGAVPSGPRTGSTSQFSSGASFLPGGSPMANLIAGQRQGLGQDPFSTYLRTFTPSYSAYDAPVTPEEYGQASTPLIGTQYNNPFTGGFNQGGQVSNGIMDLTNFDTNVQPFQNAFRPNVPRN
tara:strand:+ start:115 stop:1599 length:1485 start_codon:yes stop_codon:yes gene_type:complete